MERENLRRLLEPAEGGVELQGLESIGSKLKEANLEFSGLVPLCSSLISSPL